MERSISRNNTYSIVLCALFSVIIAAGAFIKIPVYPVPVTLQLQFVLLAGLILGAKRGSVSVIIYILVGLMGLPVFAHGGGIGYVLQPTFGYIVGFVPAAYAAGCIKKRLNNAGLRGYLLASLMGGLIVYLVGFVYFYLISRFYLHVQTELWAMFLSVFLMPLPGDIVLCIAGALFAKRIEPAVSRYINTNGGI